MNNEIRGLDGLEAEDTDEAVENIGSLLEDDERIEDFQKKLVSSIDTVSYDSIRYVLKTDDGDYRLEVLYNVNGGEVKQHDLEKV